MLAALYTLIHFILFALFGVLVMFLMHRGEQTSLLMLALMLFAVFEVCFTGSLRSSSRRLSVIWRGIGSQSAIHRGHRDGLVRVAAPPGRAPHLGAAV